MDWLALVSILFLILPKSLPAVNEAEKLEKHTSNMQDGGEMKQARRSYGDRSWVKLANGTEVEVFPIKEKLKYWLDTREQQESYTRKKNSRRKVSSSSAFEMCAKCRCCDATQTMCIQAPCCFSIVCDDPKQPFGVCSLTPFTCTCMTC